MGSKMVPVSTCRPSCQSAVDLMDDSVSSQSCQPLYVQTFNHTTIFRDLELGRRKSFTGNSTLRFQRRPHVYSKVK